LFTINQYKAIETYCKRIVKRAKSNLRRKNKLASGSLYDSITYRINKRNSSFQFEYAQHGEFVEKGRRRGIMPPVEPIAKWIKQRGLNLSPWAVAKSIKKKGIKPYPFISNEIDKSQEELHDLLLQAYQRDIDEV
jgi:hypothetical protein